MTQPTPDIFSALANPIRRDILTMLVRGPKSANDIAHQFTVGRPAVSEHLQVLRKARLVREEPRGRERYYHLDPRPLNDVRLWLDAFSHYWNERFLALGSVLAEEEAKTLPTAAALKPSEKKSATKSRSTSKK